jgi:hypothetical protein
MRQRWLQWWLSLTLFPDSSGLRPCRTEEFQAYPRSRIYPGYVHAEQKNFRHIRVPGFIRATPMPNRRVSGISAFPDSSGLRPCRTEEFQAYPRSRIHPGYAYAEQKSFRHIRVPGFIRATLMHKQKSRIKNQTFKLKQQQTLVVGGFSQYCDSGGVLARSVWCLGGVPACALLL